jgi:hypothetical protein
MEELIMPRHVETQEMLETVRLWAQSLYPGFPAETISVRLRHMPTPIRLPVPSEMPTELPSPLKSKRSEDESVFVPTPFQRAVLEALDGKALRTDALVSIVGDRSRLFRKIGGLQELQGFFLSLHRIHTALWQTRQALNLV